MGMVEDYGRGPMRAILALAATVAALLTGFSIPIAIVAHSSSTGAFVGARHTCKPDGHRRCRSPATASSSPSPTDSSSPTPAATSSSPSPSPASTTSTSWNCITSNEKGHCPFSGSSQITGASSDPWVDQNVWSPISGWQQTLYANSPGGWQVVANMPAGNTAVVSFPNTGVFYSGTVDSYSQITSSFSENMHATSGTSGWAMYDLWLNDWANEVMIQYDFANNGDCDTVATATFGGSNGVPVQDWHLCKFGSVLDWKLGTGEQNKVSEQSGSVDILTMIKWLEGHGYLPSGSTWTAISNGFEVCSTGGQRENFTVSSFSLTANRK
jgi:hypothetical protein